MALAAFWASCCNIEGFAAGGCGAGRGGAVFCGTIGDGAGGGVAPRGSERSSRRRWARVCPGEGEDAPAVRDEFAGAADTGMTVPVSGPALPPVAGVIATPLRAEAPPAFAPA